MFDIKRRDWLEISDVAKKLSVSESKIFSMALDEELRLSVIFHRNVIVKQAKLMSLKFAKIIFDVKSKREIITGPYWSNPDLFTVSPQPEEITGIWDLPMAGGEIFDVERAYEGLISGAEITNYCAVGTFLQSSDGEIFQLQQISLPGNYYPATRLPTDSRFIVRVASLNEYQNLHRTSDTSLVPLTGKLVSQQPTKMTLSPLQPASASDSAPTVSPPVLRQQVAEQATVHKIRNRTPSVLAAEICQAKKQALNPDDKNSVWTELVKMTEKKVGCLLEMDGEDIKYKSGDKISFFKSRNLKERMIREKQKRRASPH